MPRPRTSDPQPGLLAKYDADCPRCPDPIVAGVSRVVYQRGSYIHCGCASGSDE